MSSRFFVGLGAWLLGAVTATTGSMIAVNELAHGLLAAQTQQLGGTTVSADLDSGASSTDPSPAGAVPAVQATKPARVTHSATPSASTAATGTLLVSSAGSVMATCGPAGAYLQYWSPDQGFEADNVYRGPAAVARVVFSGAAGDVVMRVSCSNGTPIAHVYGESDGGGDRPGE